MEYQEGTLKCSNHEGRKAIGICTVKVCTKKNLCLHCLNSHEGSHNSKIIFLDENYLYEDDSLLSYAKTQREKYLNSLVGVIKGRKNYLEDAKMKIEKSIEIILNEFTKNLKEQEVAIFDKLKNDYFLKNSDDFEVLEVKLDELEKIQFTDIAPYSETVKNLVTCLTDVLPDIDDILAKNKIDILDDAKMLELESLAEINDKGIEKINENFKKSIQDIKVSNVAKINQGGTVFEYSGTDYDKKGLFYWFGTEKGEKDSWENPCNKKFLKVTSTSISNGKLESLTINQVHDFYTTNALDSWVAFELLEDMKFCPTSYTLGFTNTNSNYGASRSWNFEGSNDGEKWDLIKEYKNDTTLTKEKLSFTFPVEGNEFYSRFRIKQTDKESNGCYFLTISGIDLYGILQN